VTSRPAAKSCITKKTTCDVKGLRAGSSYTFSVVAKNGSGASQKSTSNRVKVAKVSAYFLARLSVLRKATSSEVTAFGTAPTNAQALKDLNKLRDSFGAFITALGLEKWPLRARSHISSFIADTRAFATSTIDSLEALPANASEDYASLQGATNKEVRAEGSLYTDLGLVSPISAPISATPSALSLGSVQTIHDLYGDPISVTATQVIDPATAAPGSGIPNAGYRFVAVAASLTNGTNQTIDGDANYSMSVVGSDGQSYSADFGTVSQCSNFNYGDFDLAAGGGASGCVVFEMPISVTVQSIQFTLAPNYLDTAEWSS
jgi:hypothetical protein